MNAMPPDLVESIIGVYCNILGLPDLAATDDFFELGGDSLLAVQVAAVLSTTLEVEVAVADVFINPTPGELAEAVRANMTGSSQ